MWCIYAITHRESGKQYIGQTRQLLTQRLKQHYGNKTSYIGKAIQKHGRDAFDATILHKCNQDNADELETDCIAEMKTLAPDGYNLDLGGHSAHVIRGRFGRKRKDGRILPQYVCAVKSGYVVCHPSIKRKWFSSSKLTDEKKLEMAKEYLTAALRGDVLPQHIHGRRSHTLACHPKGLPPGIFAFGGQYYVSEKSGRKFFRTVDEAVQYQGR